MRRFFTVSIFIAGIFTLAAETSVAFEEASLLTETNAEAILPEPENTENEQKVSGPKLQINVQAIAVVRPKFEGSDRYSASFVPMLNLQYGPLFASMTQGLGMYVPANESRTLIFIPSLHVRPKRKLGENTRIGDLRPTANMHTTMRFDQFSLNLRVSEGLASDNGGALCTFGAGWNKRVADKTWLGFTASATCGDGAYNRAYFGISESESAEHGYDVYKPSAGFKSVETVGAFRQILTEKVSLDLALRFTHLTGQAAKSPIVSERRQLMSVLIATYRF